MQTPDLTTDRLRLTLPRPDQAAAALAYVERARAHLAATEPNRPAGFYTQEFWTARLMKSIDEFERDVSVRFFIARLEAPGTFIGSINFTQIFRAAFQACYLGYAIEPACEGRGMMREALQRAIAYMFEERHIHRIMANHLPENTRSANVLARLGFRKDGESPEYLYINGAWRTHVLTSLTNTRWTPRPEDHAIF